MKNHFIITFDGPAGVGKSTLAKLTASTLHIAYLDTGAMFRTIGLKALATPTGSILLQEKNGAALLQLIGSLDFSLSTTKDSTELWCNGQKMGSDIRTEEAATNAAKVAQLPEIRDYLKEKQQQIGCTTSLVAEGRDMGTVVFPHATYKFFLDASPQVRSERRYKQLQELGHPADIVAIKKQIIERDTQDRNRAIAPLKAAQDAITVDTSYLSQEELLQIILGKIQSP